MAIRLSTFPIFFLTITSSSSQALYLNLSIAHSDIQVPTFKPSTYYFHSNLQVLRLFPHIYPNSSDLPTHTQIFKMDPASSQSQALPPSGQPSSISQPSLNANTIMNINFVLEAAHVLGIDPSINPNHTVEAAHVSGTDPRMNLNSIVEDSHISGADTRMILNQIDEASYVPGKYPRMILNPVDEDGFVSGMSPRMILNEIDEAIYASGIFPIMNLNYVVEAAHSPGAHPESNQEDSVSYFQLSPPLRPTSQSDDEVSAIQDSIRIRRAGRPSKRQRRSSYNNRRSGAGGFALPVDHPRRDGTSRKMVDTEGSNASTPSHSTGCYSDGTEDEYTRSFEENGTLALPSQVREGYVLDRVSLKVRKRRMVDDDSKRSMSGFVEAGRKRVCAKERQEREEEGEDGLPRPAWWSNPMLPDDWD